MMNKNYKAALLTIVLFFPAGIASAQSALPPDIDPVSLSRVPLAERGAMSAEDQAIYDKVAGVDRTTPLIGPAGVSLHMPKVAQAMDILNQYLRYDSIIGRRYIETAILVAAREFDQQYEWSAHEPTALAEGAPAATVDAIKFDGPVDALEEKDRLIVTYGREIFREHRLSPETWAATVDAFTQQGALEIAAIMGDYLLAAVLLHAVDQKLPPERPALMPE